MTPTLGSVSYCRFIWTNRGLRKLYKDIEEDKCTIIGKPDVHHGLFSLRWLVVIQASMDPLPEDKP